MHKLTLKLLFCLFGAVSLSGHAFAVADAACKYDCLSQKSAQLAKHRCCPAVSLKSGNEIKLTQKCTSCLENRDVPLASGVISEVKVAPESVSEAILNPTPAKNLLQATQKARTTSYQLPHSSVTIILQRFLI